MSDSSRSESYKKAGVDVQAGYEAVKRMRAHVESTFTPGVLGSIGGFGGLFAPDLTGIQSPVLVSGTDGVGTKLKIAFLTEKHDTIGIDCVAMCVNDIVCAGAMPLFFLDYLAVGKLKPEVAAAIVSGVAHGCREASCALIGGETAEMPGFYAEGEYDLAGFSVGMVDRDKMIDGRTLIPGDVLIGLKSSGLHSNGFSLVRHILNPTADSVNQYVPELSKLLGAELLTPTRIYVRAVRALLEAVSVKSLCHITGGGFYENIPRMLKHDVTAVIEKHTFLRPSIFDYLMARGKVPERDMYNTFNMGLGMIAAVSKDDADHAIAALREAGEDAYIVGAIMPGGGDVKIV